MNSIEQNFVVNTYNTIYKEFDKTRYSVWSFVKKYLDSLPKGSKVLEIGCGNGKNMLYRKDLNFYGCDVSCKQVELCLQKKLNVKLCDICNLQYKDNEFDYVICIATFHHLATKERRIKALQEIRRVCKNTCLLSIWDHKKKTEYIKFNNVKRYYHILIS